MEPEALASGHRAILVSHGITSGWVLCHECRRSTRRRATVLEMKEGPSGSAIRSPIPSHRERLWSKAMVVRGAAAESAPAANVEDRSIELSVSGN
jgi:hypothetical protein